MEKFFISTTGAVLQSDLAAVYWFDANKLATQYGRYLNIHQPTDFGDKEIMEFIEWEID